MSDNSNNDETAPLPSGWVRCYSKSQQKNYYFHKASNTNQWHFPTATEAENPEVAKRRLEENVAKQQEATMKNKKPRLDDNNVAAAAAADANLMAVSVAIIVPFRDLHPEQNRAAHLKKFVPHMTAFLKSNDAISSFRIYIVEQSNDDGYKFNRGKLLNIGFDMAKKNKHDIFIFHDVDLLPDSNLASSYSTFPRKPLHIARVWGRYSNNPKYFGGAVSFSSADFKRINGYPNNFWGWGGEDDEMQRRLERLSMTFDAPTSGTMRDLEAMDINEKMEFLRTHKTWKCMVKWELQDEHEKTWKTNGLSDLKYELLSETSLNSSATRITVNVKLNGTHWTNEKAGLDYLPSK